jgi:hypothetical protein
MSLDKSNEDRAAELDAKLKTKKDASIEGQELDKMLTRMGDAMAQFDAFFAKKDAEDCEKAKMDAAKKDAKEDDDMDDTEAEKLVADRKRAKADAVLTPERADAIADAYMRADQVYATWGQTPPHAMSHESVQDYEARLARPLQKHSKEFGAVDLSKLDSATHAGVISRVFADAVAAANDPASYTEGLREVQTRDHSGRVITSFKGQPRAWLSQFTAPSMRASIDTSRQHARG